MRDGDDAPLKMLVIDPHLPDWLPEITLRELRVGKARVTIRFRRERAGARRIAFSTSAAPCTSCGRRRRGR